MDISKYKPTQKILDKLEGYRKKGSKVNVKAITNPDKLFTYYYAGKLMNWKDLLNDIWDKVSYDDRDILKEINTAVSADSTLEDSRSADEVALQNISRVVATYLKEKNLSYTLTSRQPYHNELEMDRRNGRCWTLAYTLTVEGTLKIDFANHTNEGGGTYGYSIGGYGWNVLSKKELENQIIRKIEESDLGTSHTDFHEEFEVYENLWEDVEDTPAEKKFSSEYARLKSTPEGREYLKSLNVKERCRLEKEYTSATPSYKLVSSYYEITLEYGDYSYDANAHDVFDAVFELLDYKENLAKISNKELVNEYNALIRAWVNAAPEDELETLEAVEYFIADNLDELVSELYDDVLEYFEERAADWAKSVGLYHWDA